MNIILTTNKQTLDFLSTKPNADEEIVWGCPECHVRNIGTYFSHQAKCSHCKNGRFPAIPLPVVGGSGISLQRAFACERIRVIKSQMDDIKDEIRSLESELEEKEIELNHLKSEKNNLEMILE